MKPYLVVVFWLAIVVASLTHHQQRRSKATEVCAQLGAGKRVWARAPGNEIQFRLKGQWVPFPGSFRLPLERPALGPGVQFQARFRCLASFRNPVAWAPWVRGLRFPRVVASGEVRWRGPRRSTWFQKTLSRFPTLRSLGEAVWRGEAAWISPQVREFYRHGGLLHVLALSGQHVLVLVGLAHGGLRLLGRAMGRALPGLRYVSAGLPLFCALVLWTTSGGAPSVVRTTWMIAVALFVRGLRWSVSSLQTVCSAAAVALLWNPAWLGRPGFLLSVVVTALLIECCQEFRWEFWLRRWGFVSLGLPVLLFPITAYFFAKISLVASLVNVALGWVWTLGLIPLGYVLPVLSFLPDVVLKWLDSGVAFVFELPLALAPWIQSTYITVPRLSLVETVLWEFLFLCAALQLRARLTCH